MTAIAKPATFIVMLVTMKVVTLGILPYRFFLFDNVTDVMPAFIDKQFIILTILSAFFEVVVSFFIIAKVSSLRNWARVVWCVLWGFYTIAFSNETMRFWNIESIYNTPVYLTLFQATLGFTTLILLCSPPVNKCFRESKAVLT